MHICYDEIQGGISITRMYGDSPVVRVPGEVDGKKTIAINEYAFSEKNVTTNRKDIPYKELDEGTVCELAGGYIKEIIIPDSVRSLGGFCFYQCVNLNKLTLGKNVQIGSDAFMNCRKLDEIHITASVLESTCLRQILAQRTQHTTAVFDDAAIYFPEYSEQYDLIGPAHIFELNIEGEGFRARKCFDGDVFLPEMYDDIFEKARDTEDTKTLCIMASLRLQKPELLKEEKKKIYQEYLLENISEFLDESIRKKDLKLFLDMKRKGIINNEHIVLCLQKLNAAGWIEGTREVISDNNL